MLPIQPRNPIRCNAQLLIIETPIHPATARLIPLRTDAMPVRFFVRREERFERGKVDERFRHETACACLIAEIADNSAMKTYTAVVERDPDTGLLVGYVPGFPGAHTQAESLDELRENLREVIAMLLEDGEPKLESEFVGLQTIQVA